MAKGESEYLHEVRLAYLYGVGNLFEDELKEALRSMQPSLKVGSKKGIASL